MDTRSSEGREALIYLQQIFGSEIPEAQRVPSTDADRPLTECQPCEIRFAGLTARVGCVGRENVSTTIRIRKLRQAYLLASRRWCWRVSCSVASAVARRVMRLACTHRLAIIEEQCAQRAICRTPGNPM
ncbi:hypothetical protein HYPDE_25058 [Hyphomicrobium denitrificans 1NES1]|uniref:Uncharacterized protein n=1 Tax=Hyphomicrobium denitrificans 1NES1 TaxID=670307 RepID=N0B829_9HYPH|nr:hypothetical protein HYPDE_25058 [Hyphomicrobium denitrificans 1NES1]